ADLLELIGDDGHITAGGSDRDRSLRRLRLRRRHAQDQEKPRRGADESTTEMRPVLSQTSSSEKEAHAISGLFDRARLIPPCDSQHVAEERQRSCDTKDRGSRFPRGES